MMSFIKGMAAGMVAGAIAGVILTPKPRNFNSRLKKKAGRAAKQVEDFVEGIVHAMG